MLALKVLCWISCGITLILWLLYGFKIARIKSIRVTAIISTIVWVVTSLIVYSGEY